MGVHHEKAVSISFPIYTRLINKQTLLFYCLDKYNYTSQGILSCKLRLRVVPKYRVPLLKMQNSSCVNQLAML